MILILLWFMFHSLHISTVACTELQLTSRLVNSSLEVLLHLVQLCSAEVEYKMMGFNTYPQGNPVEIFCLLHRGRIGLMLLHAAVGRG